MRSHRGDRGYWYHAALDAPDDVELTFADERVPVRAVPASNGESIAACSAALKAKYRKSVSLASMLLPNTLETTLELLPRT